MSDIFAVVWPILAVPLTVLTVLGTIQLLLLTTAAVLRRRPSVGREDEPFDSRMAIVVPAHDEEHGIVRTVESLMACEGASEGAIVVVADNCTDATAPRAKEAGARVLVRRDAESRGKGFALDFAFRTLLNEGFDVFVIIDADTVVEPNLLTEVRQAIVSGADATQTRYTVLDPETSLRHRLLNLAFIAFNVVRPRGRDRLGLSVGIFGNGFALSRSTLESVPYRASSIVEDLEYHLRLVQAGKRVRFLDQTTVRGQMPAAGAGVRTQRARWEGGRLLMVRQFLPALFADVLRGRIRMLEPLLDLSLLPLAYHIALLFGTLLIPFAPTRLYAGIGLAIVAFHVLAAFIVGRLPLRDLLILAVVPFYLIWKIAMAPMIARAGRRKTAWVRTERG